MWPQLLHSKTPVETKCRTYAMEKRRFFKAGSSSSFASTSIASASLQACKAGVIVILQRIMAQVRPTSFLRRKPELSMMTIIS